jgi:hypothetical protein
MTTTIGDFTTNEELTPGAPVIAAANQRGRRTP